MYSAQITRANPTCIVMLLDQSGSMVDPFSGEAGIRKADYVADVVNHTLHDIVIRCTKTEEIRNYYHIAVIGYGRTVGSALGGALAGSDIAPIGQIAEYPLRVETRYRRVPDGMGDWVEMPIRVPIWMQAKADGGTPMCEALMRVKAILQSWIAQYPMSFPPTVLHLTDGESSDGDPTAAGKEILALGTADGPVLLFNCHISSNSNSKAEYPAVVSSLRDPFSRTLFEISSELPSNFLAAAEQLGVKTAVGSKGFVFNADPSSIVQFYEIGTSLTGMTPYRWMER
jgi:hypothetical protein